MIAVAVIVGLTQYSFLTQPSLCQCHYTTGRDKTRPEDPPGLGTCLNLCQVVWYCHDHSQFSASPVCRKSISCDEKVFPAQQHNGRDTLQRSIFSNLVVVAVVVVFLGKSDPCRQLTTDWITAGCASFKPPS